MCPIVNVNFCENEVCVGKVCVGKVDCGKFSWLKKLVPVTEFVLRFVHNFKALLNQCEVTKVGLLLAEIMAGISLIYNCYLFRREFMV